MPHVHGTWDKVLYLKHTRKIVMLKEYTRSSYSYYSILEVSVPVGELFFILTDNPSPPCGGWGAEVLPLP